MVLEFRLYQMQKIELLIILFVKFKFDDQHTHYFKPSVSEKYKSYEVDSHFIRQKIECGCLVNGFFNSND